MNWVGREVTLRSADVSANRPFQFEQLTVLSFDGSSTVCSINRGWGNEHI